MTHETQISPRTNAHTNNIIIDIIHALFAPKHGSFRACVIRPWCQREPTEKSSKMLGAHGRHPGWRPAAQDLCSPHPRGTPNGAAPAPPGATHPSGHMGIDFMEKETHPGVM